MSDTIIHDLQQYEKIKVARRKAQKAFYHRNAEEQNKLRKERRERAKAVLEAKYESGELERPIPKKRGRPKLSDSEKKQKQKPIKAKVVNGDDNIEVFVHNPTGKPVTVKFI
jgi:hypothetical protein